MNTRLAGSAALTHAPPLSGEKVGPAAIPAVSSHRNGNRQVIVIGGGIAGLAAAWQLQQSGIDYALLEASDRWGGVIRTERVEGYGAIPFIIEHGPDAFLTRKPALVALAKELGLEDRIVGINRHQNRTYVLKGGRPVRIPDGLRLLVPTKLIPFLRSPLFSPLGKLRVLIEPLIPARRDGGDETLAAFVRRRLGAEALDRLGEPLLAGIYNGEPERQSMQATFPQFMAMEREHGSLLKAALTPGPSPGGRGEKDMPNQTSANKSTPTAETAPFVSFRTGAQELVEALAAQLHGDLRLNSAVTSIEHQSGGYRLTLADGSALEAAALIVATPAPVAGRLLANVAPESASHLSALRTVGIGAISLAFKRADVRHPLDGFGLVIPGSEGRQIDAMMWSSSKWEGRAPEGTALIRVFFGGPPTRDILDLDDAALLRLVRAELGSILGVSGAPIFWRIQRWQNVYPQYDLGHVERVAALEAALPASIALAGSAYHGVGVPDCIRLGRAAATRVAATLPHPQETL